MLKNKKKGIIIIALIAILGVAFIILGSAKQSNNNQTGELDSDAYIENLENKLESFLLSVEGINKAEVIITLENSNEQVYAQNQNTYDFLTINSGSGESAVYITEIYPIVRGIAIACTNGENDTTKVKITKLISAYLGISSNRIEIVGIK